MTVGELKQLLGSEDEREVHFEIRYPNQTFDTLKVLTTTYGPSETIRTLHITLEPAL